MKTTEIRVRPVIRHAVTRYMSEPETGCGGSELLAEFSHEAYAEEVAQALKEQSAQRDYVLVQETVGEIMAKVYYAYSEEDARAKLSGMPDSESYKVFSRVSQRLS